MKLLSTYNKLKKIKTHLRNEKSDFIKVILKFLNSTKTTANLAECHTSLRFVCIDTTHYKQRRKTSSQF